MTANRSVPGGRTSWLREATRSAGAIARAYLLSLGLLATFAGPVYAQDEPDPAAERAESFEAATGAQTENVPGGTLMVVAYGAVFLLVLGYAVSLGFRQAKTQRELEILREDLKETARRDPSGKLPPEEF